MAAAAPKTVNIVKKDTAEGHVFECFFNVPHLLEALPRRISREMYTECSNTPTFWEIAIAFERETLADPVSCSLFLTRFDNKDTPLNVEVWTCSYISYHTIVPPVTFSHNGMLPNEVIEGTITKAIPAHEVRGIQHKQLVFQVKVTIDGCHSRHSRRERSFRRDLRQMLFSKI